MSDDYVAPRRMCDEDCNNCEVPENRQFSLLANVMVEMFGEKEVYPIVQSICPNMTCCADCRIDDFCHCDGCKILREAERLARIWKSWKKRKKRYVWMVTIDGTSHGEYENGARSVLCASHEEAVQFVKSEIEDMVTNTKMVCIDYGEGQFEEAVKDHSQWFGPNEAQFRDSGSIADFRIERVLVPERRDE